MVPFENRIEAASIDELSIYPVNSLTEAISVLSSEVESFSFTSTGSHENKNFLDFSDVRGQESAKRAIEIASAGSHNIMLYGSPGTGKTMLARCIPTILPPLTRTEALEVTMVHSITGRLQPQDGLLWIPPFRTPHHTASDTALVGGGKIPTAGEVSLAHCGVLFLDEFTEFPPHVIESLRQPLEDREIVVSRASGTCTFPADFMLVGASNPCRCGYLFDPQRICSCTQSVLRRYLQKLTGPVMDRIDMEVLVNPVPCKDLLSREQQESSAIIRERVIKARSIQKKRFKDSHTRYNAHMTSREVKYLCRLDREKEKLLEGAMKQLQLSARSFFKVIKVARTIADLDNSEIIKKGHILEALSYKSPHRTIQI